MGVYSFELPAVIATGIWVMVPQIVKAKTAGVMNFCESLTSADRNSGLPHGVGAYLRPMPKARQFAGV